MTDETAMEWTSDTTERHLLNGFEWRKLNYRVPYDRALAGVLMAFERETSLCAGLPYCRPIEFGEKDQILAIEIRHHKTRCLSELLKRSR